MAVSLLLDALYAWPAYLGWRAFFAGRAFGGGQFAVAWCAAVVGVAVPYALGIVLGAQSRDGWRRVRLIRLLVGRNAAPRAWDKVFTARGDLYLRVRRRDGSWQEGFFGPNSYAGTFPHDHDLLLEQAWPTGATGPPDAAEDRYALYLSAATIDIIEISTTRKERS